MKFPHFGLCYFEKWDIFQRLIKQPGSKAIGQTFSEEN